MLFLHDILLCEAHISWDLAAVLLNDFSFASISVFSVMPDLELAAADGSFCLFLLPSLGLQVASHRVLQGSQARPHLT